MLSARGKVNADQLSIPWKFALSTTYDPISNPNGVDAARVGGIREQGPSNALSQHNPAPWAVAMHLNEILKVHIPAAAFTYGFSTAGGGTKFPAALANLFNDYFNPHQPIRGDDIKVTAAATSLHEILAFELADPGDGILISVPFYGRFELDFGNKAQVRIVHPETTANDCFDVDTVQKYDEAIEKVKGDGIRVRALLVVNPHNPLGRCYSRETLIALMRFCQEKQIHFVSDEVYALSVFDSGEPHTLPFTSVLSIDPTSIIDPNLVHVTYAMSKDFGSAGLRLGALVTKNVQLKKALLAVVRFHSSAGPSIAIGTAMLEDRKWRDAFVAMSRQRIASAYRFVTNRLRELGIHYMPGSNAAFFVWIDLSPYLSPDTEGKGKKQREVELAQRFVDAMVFLQPDEEGSPVVGWFRMVYTFERNIVEEGLGRIESVIKKAN